MNEIILNKLFISNFAFPLLLKQPVRLSCRFPRLNQITTVKASNHFLFLLWERWKKVVSDDSPFSLFSPTTDEVAAWGRD